jgi:hypothetical protein
VHRHREDNMRLVVSLLLIMSSAHAVAQAYPSKPMRRIEAS